MTDALIEQFVKLISGYTGLHIREQDRKALQHKIWTRMKARKLSNPEHYYQILAAGSDPNSFANVREGEAEWKELMLLLTTGESYFFRDRGQFHLLEYHIFKDLIERKNSRSAFGESPRVLRIWSAGCSTGEEPYSLAVLLQEMLPDWEQWDILIVGTDINQDSIEKAKRGVYSQWSFRLVDADLQRRYFIERKGEWEIKEKVRSMVKFRCGNLVQDSFPNSGSDLHNMDLIICRNVFVYFDAKAIAKVIGKFYNTLRPGGYLLTAHAELHGQHLGRFKTTLFPESVVYQRGEEASAIETAPRASALGVTSELPPLYPAIPYGIASVHAGTPPSVLNPFFAGKSLHASNPVSKALPSFNSLETATTLKTFAAPHLPTAGAAEKPDRTSTGANPDEITGEALMREAETLFKKEAYPEAIQKAEQAIAKKPRHFGAHYLIAQAHANLGQYEQANRACQLAIQIDSLSAEPYYLLAHLAEERGDIEAAKMFFKRIIYLAPASIFAYLELASLYEREGDMFRSRKMRATAVELLSELPADAIVDQQHQLQAGELLLYVRKMLGQAK